MFLAAAMVVILAATATTVPAQATPWTADVGTATSVQTARSSDGAVTDHNVSFEALAFGGEATGPFQCGSPFRDTSLWVMSPSDKPGQPGPFSIFAMAHSYPELCSDEADEAYIDEQLEPGEIHFSSAGVRIDADVMLDVRPLGAVARVVPAHVTAEWRPTGLRSKTFWLRLLGRNGIQQNYYVGRRSLITVNVSVQGRPWADIGVWGDALVGGIIKDVSIFVAH
jgi:hypothetical protein